jgi:hypothetical protein
MPSLSINSKDLDSLGINLKDLLKAIAQTKTSGDDVIKIKKRKKKVKRVKKVRGGNAGISKVSSLNPFPPPIQKLSYQPPVGGGGPGFPLSKVEIRTETGQSQQQKQTEDFQNTLKKQINTTTEATKLLLADKFFPGTYFSNQNIPPPANLSYQSSYQIRPPVDKLDRWGVVATNDFDEIAQRNDGVTFEDVTETIPIAPSEQSTEAEPTETDNLPSDSLFYDVPSDQDQEIQLPDLYPETKPITPRAKPFTTPTTPTPTKAPPVEEPVNIYKDLPENLEELVQDVKKGRGRPKGSRNKENPLTQNQAHPTRKNHDELFAQPTDLGISPYSLANEENKKQKMLDRYFKKKSKQKGNDADSEN